MKKAIVVIALFAALGLVGCEQPTDDTTSVPVEEKTSLTVKNECFSDLIDVKWSGIDFAKKDNTLGISDSVSKMVDEGDGYIYFSRKSNPIVARTQEKIVVEKGQKTTFTFQDNTLVVEATNPDNTGKLSELISRPQLSIEYSDRAVNRNGDSVSIGQTTANMTKSFQFMMKNSGGGTLRLTGNEPVKLSSTDDVFSLVQPSGSEITPNSPLSFTINITPKSAGDFTATITVKSNDFSGDFIFTISATTNVVGPAMVTEVSATAVSSTSIAVSWNSVSGATGYRIYRSTTAIGTYIQTGTVPSSVITYTNTGLTADTTYYYKVSAYNSDGESAQSDAVSATTNAFIPGIPGGVSVIAASSTSITVSWNSVSVAAGYRIYRSTTANGTYTQVGAVSSPATTYTNTDLTHDTTYYYKVSAFNSAGESAQSAYDNTTTNAVISAAPTGVTAIAASSSSVTVSWSSVTGATTGYHLYRSTTAEGIYIQVGPTLISATNYIDTGLSSATTYYYKVSVYNSAGESDRSSYAASMTLPVTPTGVSAATTSSTSITVSWSSVIGADEYRIYCSTTATGTYTHLGTALSTATTYANINLPSGTTYYYKVSAYNSGGESAQSSYVSAVTTPVAPTGVSATAVSYSSITVSWTRMNGATEYRIYRSTTATGSYSNVGTAAGTATTYTNTGLSASTTYYYKVSAYNSAGESGQSSSVTATTPAVQVLSPPSGIGAIPVSNGIRINWVPVYGAAGYRVYRATSANGTYTAIATNVSSTTTTYLNTTTGSTTYYYKVATVNSAGVVGSLSGYNYSAGPGILITLPHYSSANTFYKDTITATGEKYYRFEARGGYDNWITWADAGDGGSNFSPALTGDIVVAAVYEDTGEVIFYEDDGYKGWYLPYSTTNRFIIVQVAPYSGSSAGTFCINYNYSY
jgi:fibronectin type 3 domain-containing protein